MFFQLQNSSGLTLTCILNVIRIIFSEERLIFWSASCSSTRRALFLTITSRSIELTTYLIFTQSLYSGQNEQQPYTTCNIRRHNGSLQFLKLCRTVQVSPLLCHIEMRFNVRRENFAWCMSQGYKLLLRAFLRQFILLTINYHGPP